MRSLYYFAAWTDSGCFMGCEHEHATVISAVACIASAGGYVIAVENSELRELNEKEEMEFQFAMYGGQVAGSRLRAFAQRKVLKPLMH